MDQQPFADDFSLLPHREGKKFDVVLMCHSAYFFHDKLESTIDCAHSFLKPDGKLLLVTEGAPNDHDTLMKHILPDNHGERIDSEEIVSRLSKKYPSMVHRQQRTTALVDVDDVVRGTANADSATVAYLSIVLGSPYEKMSSRIQKQIVDNIVAINRIVNGKYCLHDTNVADEISI